MSAANTLDDVKLLVQFIRQMAAKTASEISKIALTIEELPTLTDLSSEWTALIHLHGPEFKLALQIHFTTALAKTFAGSAFGSPPEELSQAEAADFMMEVANIATGRVKRALSLNEIKVSMGLPLVIGEYGETVTSSPAPWFFTDKWRIKSPHGDFGCSFYIEASKPFVLVDRNSLSEGNVDVQIR